MPRTQSTTHMTRNAPQQKPSKTSTTSSKRRVFNGLTIEQRQAIRKDKLISAGLELYGTHGFFQVKINDICSEAKLTARYFYESFSKAEELFNAVFEQQVTKLHAEILAAFLSKEDDQTAESTAQRCVISYLQTIKSDKRMARIIYIDSLLVPDTDTYVKVNVHERFTNMIETIIQTTILKQSELTNLTRYAIAGFSGYCTHVCLNWVKDDFNESIEAVAEVILTLSNYFLSILQDPRSELHAKFIVASPTSPTAD